MCPVAAGKQPVTLCPHHFEPVGVGRFFWVERTHAEVDHVVKYHPEMCPVPLASHVAGPLALTDCAVAAVPPVKYEYRNTVDDA